MQNLKKDVPKDVRIIRETRYPNGKAYIEYRAKEYIPRCSNVSCCGRTVKRYKTDLLARTAWNMRSGRKIDAAARNALRGAADRKEKRNE